MKKLLFLLLGCAVAVSASAGIQTKAVSKKAALNPSIPAMAVKNANLNLERPLINKIDALTSNPISLRANRLDIPEGYVAVTLEAHDVWGDGTGYQLLLDADATAVTDTIIVPNLNDFEPGDLPESFYAEFEYKIPENADGSVTTQNMVFDGSVTIYMPAGVYDWVVLNPSPNDNAENNRFWVPGVNGKYSQFEFTAGFHYHFTVVYDSNYGDNVTLQIEEPGSALSVPENLSVTPGDTYANVIWTDNDDLAWNLRWRPYNPNAGETYVWNWDTNESFAGWRIWDADGDGDSWGYIDNETYTYSGGTCMISASYDFDNYSALYPQNFLISPEVKLNGTLKVAARGYSYPSYADGFALYVNTTEDITNIDNWEMVGEQVYCTDAYVEYSFDLSAYEGATGCFAIVHNTEDCYYLFVDDITLEIPGDEPAPWNYVYNLDETEYKIENLTPETTYEVQVQAAGNLGTSEWTPSEIFTTTATPAIPDVYILGEVNEQGWAANAGTLMTYDAENNIYTATVSLDGRNEGYNYFSFTNELAMDNDDGAWEYIKPFRFGAVSNGDFEFLPQYDGQPIDITYDNGQAFMVPAGEYDIVVDLANMKAIITKKNVEPPVMVGDVNKDGKVSIADVTALIAALMNNVTDVETDNYNPAAADIDGDGFVKITDVTGLISNLMNPEN